MTVELFNATANSMMLCLIKMIHSAPRLMPLRLLLPQARRGERNAWIRFQILNMRDQPHSCRYGHPDLKYLAPSLSSGLMGQLTWLGALVLLFWRHLRKGYLPNEYGLVIFLHN